VRAAQGISLPPASALQRHQLRKDYGGEHSAGALEAVSFAISPASTHVCASTPRLSLFLSPPQDAPSSALRYACLHGLSVATAHACYSCRTRPLLLIVPSLLPGRPLLCIPSCCSCYSALSHTSSLHNFLDLNECTTLHRTNVPGQVKVKRKAFYFSLHLPRLSLFVHAFPSSTIPCTPTISHGVSHHRPATVCAPGRRWLPSDSQRGRSRSPTSTRKVVSKLIVAGPTSTVDHGAFSTGSSQRRTTAPGVSPTVSYGPNAQQQGWRWQAAVASHGAEEVSGLTEVYSFLG
jgi:hypothetical protein